MLEHEVTDDDVGDLSVHAVQPLAGDRAKLDAIVLDRGARSLQHRRRDVECEHAIESLRERRGHPAGAAADLDARASARIRAEPAEERFELGAASLGVTDVDVGSDASASHVARMPRAPTR